MKAKVIWDQELQEKTGKPHCLWSTASNKNSVAVTAGPEILVYSTTTGKIMRSLKGHKDQVLSVDWSLDGQIMASGGADKSVIIWDSTKALLKYSHAEQVQTIAINPVTNQVVSACATEIVAWKQGIKSVNRIKPKSRVLCAKWSPSGQLLALGHSDGTISLYSRELQLVLTIQKGNSPVFTIEWTVSEEREIFLATDGKVLSFYSTDGSLIQKERKLSILATKSSSISDEIDSYAMFAGENGVEIWTWEGVRVWQFQLKDTLTSVSFISSKKFISATQNGKIQCYDIELDDLISTFKQRIAYREGWSDVVIFDQKLNQKARIRCRDFVKSISIYQNSLAIGLVDRLVIYKCPDAETFHYKQQAKFSISDQYNSILMLNEHILVASEKLELVSIQGTVALEWSLVKPLVTQRSMTIVGGQASREIVLVGLSDGSIIKLQMNNPMAIPVLKLTNGITSLQVSSDKKVIMALDEMNQMTLINNFDHQILSTDNLVTDAVWHSEFPNLLLILKQGQLCVQYKQFESKNFAYSGTIGLFTMDNVSTFDGKQLNTFVISLVGLFNQLLDQDEDDAFELASLVNSSACWNALGQRLLEKGHVTQATRAFQKSKNFLWIEMANLLSNEPFTSNKSLAIAVLNAAKGDWNTAIKQLIQSNNGQFAIEMLVDLQKFEEAGRLATQLQLKDDGIMQKRARVLLDSGEIKLAATLYLQSGNSLEAVNILIQHKMFAELAELSCLISPKDKEAIEKCISNISDKNCLVQLFTRIQDSKRLVMLHVKHNEWPEALNVAGQDQELVQILVGPYTNWLLMNNKADEAQKIILKSGNFEFVNDFMRQLIDSAIIEGCYSQVATFSWTLATLYLKALETHADPIKLKLEFDSLKRQTLIYRAYHGVYQYAFQPFTDYSLLTLLNMCKYLLGQSRIENFDSHIRLDAVVYSLVKICKQLGLFKSLERLCNNILDSFIFPPEWQNEIDCIVLSSRNPVQDTDPQDYLNSCYSCGNTSNLVVDTSNLLECKSCHHPFVFSPLSFETLPLVQVLMCEADSLEATISSAFVNYTPARIDSKHAQQLDELDQLVVIDHETRYTDPLYYMLLEGAQVSQCNSCKFVFHQEEWEFSLISQKSCSVCLQK